MGGWVVFIVWGVVAAVLSENCMELNHFLFEYNKRHPIRAFFACPAWPIVLPVVGIIRVIKKSEFKINKPKQLPEAPLVDTLTIEQENEKLLDQYHANMVRISEIEFTEMKKLS